MHPQIHEAMRERRSRIESRWVELLTWENVDVPLAHPARLSFWIPTAVQRVLGYLQDAVVTEYSSRSVREFGCDCGRNPYLAFYRAGEQALLEALEEAVATVPALMREGTEAQQVHAAVQRLGLRDIDQFCRVCVRATSCKHQIERRVLLEHQEQRRGCFR